MNIEKFKKILIQFKREYKFPLLNAVIFARVCSVKTSEKLKRIFKSKKKEKKKIGERNESIIKSVGINQGAFIRQGQ